MANPYPARLTEDNGKVRFVGDVDFTDSGNQPGGTQPVSCNLLLASLDVSSQTTHALNWDGLQDNPWDENPLASLPAGLGLAVAFDGSDGTITMTAAGTWAFSTALALQQGDAAWIGDYDDGLWGRTTFPFLPSDISFLIVGAVMTLPTGAQLQPLIQTRVAAASAQHVAVSLIVTRLA